MRIFLLVFLAVCFLPAKSQNWDWATDGGGLGSDKAIAVRVDASDNIYIAGFFNRQASFDSIQLYSIGNWGTDKDIFVAKYNANGTCIWAVSAGGPNDDRALGMDLDGQGNIYITGTYWGSMVAGTIVLPSNQISGGDEVFVAKLNPQGQWIWVTSAGSVNDDHGIDIVADATGNSYVTGFHTNAFYFRDSLNAILPSSPSPLPGVYDTLLFVSKLDPNGAWKWARHFGRADGERDHGICLDGDSILYIAGGYFGNRYFGNDTLTSAGGRDIFVTKIDTAGNFLWARSAGSDKDDRANAVSADGTGQVYITGEFRDSCLFAPGILLDNFDKRDIFVAKIDQAGAWQWARQAGGFKGSERGNDIWSLAGTVYVTGEADSGAVFGPYTMNNTGFDSLNIFTARIDQAGNWQWVAEAGGHSSKERGNGIAHGSGNTVYVCGYYDQSAGFGTAGTVTSAGRTDAYLAKIDDLLAVNTPAENIFSCTVFPNPSGDFLQFDVHLPANGPLKATLYDITGRACAMLFDRKSETSGRHHFSHAVSDLPAGVYFLRLETDRGIYAYRFVCAR